MQPIGRSVRVRSAMMPLPEKPGVVSWIPDWGLGRARERAEGRRERKGK